MEKATVKLSLIATFLCALFWENGECVDSTAAEASLSEYPYAVYVNIPNMDQHYVGLAISKNYLIGPYLWLDGYEDKLYNIKVYQGPNPEKSSKILPITAHSSRSLVFVKVRGDLKTKGTMALTPNLFTDFSEDQPGKLIFFTPKKQLWYVNTTVMADTKCSILNTNSDVGFNYEYESEEESCTDIVKLESCTWYTDESTYRSEPVMVVNGQPVAMMFLSSCDENDFLFRGPSIYTKILPNREAILNFMENNY